jgi:hypothetical protein
MKERRLGTALLVLGVALLAGTATLGPALADIEQSPSGDDTNETPPRTVVGVQGVGGYATGGYVAELSGRSVAWREDSSDTYFDVTKLSNGTLLAAYMTTGYERCGEYESPCPRTGYRVIDPDPTPQVVAEWSFPVRSRHNSEVHDVEPLPGGGVLLVDMEHERVVVVENGTVTWEWLASERYDAPEDPTRTDWLHMNDVDRIGDGRYLVSVRNANQLLVLERGEGVVEVINRDEDGDGVGDEELLHRQHNPQWLGDGAVLVADSENHRVVELHRTANGSWEPAWVLRGADGRKFDWPRDADRLPNGTTLITDTRNARLVEVNETGSVVWTARLDYQALPYEADRLPHGERVGAPRYGTDDSEGNGPDDIPVATPALRLLSSAVRLPLWFAELHLLATVAGVLSTAGGGVVRWRASD